MYANKSASCPARDRRCGCGPVLFGPTPPAPMPRPWRSPAAPAAGSSQSSQARQVGDEIVQLARREAIAIRRHGRLAPLLSHRGDFALEKRTDAPFSIADLNREGVFIQAAA